jgi:hypothetical protein
MKRKRTMTEDGLSLTVRLDRPSREWIERIKAASGVSHGTIVRQAISYAGPRLMEVYSQLGQPAATPS